MRTAITVLVISIIAILFNVWYFSAQSPQSSAPDFKNIAYQIDGMPVMLVNGQAETEAAPGSATKVTTKYFGDDSTGDLNGDGVPDKAFLLTHETGGSGTFFYIAAALKQGEGYQGIAPMLLGDRIAPQNTEIRDGVITVNYADRKPNDPMTAEPSVGVSRYFRVEKGALVETVATSAAK